MDLLKLYPLGCSDGQTLWILDTTLCMLRGNGGQNIVLPPLQSAPPSHKASPSPAAPLLSHGWDCSRGGKEAPVPVWTRVPEYGHTFILRPGSWGSPPTSPSSLAPCAVGLKKGWKGVCVSWRVSLGLCWPGSEGSRSSIIPFTPSFV